MKTDYLKFLVLSICSLVVCSTTVFADDHTNSYFVNEQLRLSDQQVHEVIVAKQTEPNNPFDMRNTHISLDSATKIEGVFDTDNDKPQIVEHYEIARKKGLAPQTFLAQGLVLGDYVTTVWSMNKGAVEGNPLMPKSKSGQALATAVKLGALTYI